MESKAIENPDAMRTRLIKGVAEVKTDWLKLYLITNRKYFPPETLLEKFEAALKGGVRDIQLREKDLPLSDLLSLAIVLRQMTERYEARLYINDRLDIALMVEADGVHLPEDGLPPNEVKARYPHLLVGVSTHSLESARQAETDGADFITFSPIFATPSKKQYGESQGLEKLKSVTKAVRIPVLALGGIDKHRINTVLETGAHGVAMISAIWNSPNIQNESFEYMKFFAGDSHDV
jgi:thiamine-phosphate pyrophosphorylase